MSPSRLPTQVCLAALLAASPAAAIPLLDGFGGADGYGTPDHCVAAGNDNSYAAPGAAGPTAIDLAPAFPGGLAAYGLTLTRFFLNTNGTITFAAPLATPSPIPFPIADQAMIAPWWADVDTRAGGSVCYHLEPTRLVATWHDVGYFDGHADRRNDFQLILSMRPQCDERGEFGIDFRYHRCEWTHGDGSALARVGFDAGNLTNHVTLPQSGTAAITDLCTTTNVPGGEPGLYRFLIRQGTVGPVCAGLGLPCRVPGLQGICAEGIGRCDVAASVCAPVRAPRAPGCDGYDSDCDGRVDATCAPGLVCDRDRCLAPCAADRPCPAGLTCTARGTCDAPACADVACPLGERCTAGRCVPRCDAFDCSRGERCDEGRCVGACAYQLCDARHRCDPDPSSTSYGTCVLPCECYRCEAGRVCAPDGRCVSPPRDAGVDAAPDVAFPDATTPDATTPDAAPPDVAPTADVAPPGRLLDAGCGCRVGPASRPRAASSTAVALLLAALAPLRFLLRRRALARRRAYLIA